MESEELKKILFDYKRNKKRIEQIRSEYYSISSIRYDQERVKTYKVNKDVEQKVVSLLSNREYVELDKKVKAVERTRLRLDARQQIVFDEYFMNKRDIRWISINKPITRRTAYREIERIIYICQEEILK